MTFVSPILLIGLIAAGIPFLLHLISSVRAQEEQFPTLRFLKLSMQKNARRRKLQNWLLLVLRSLLLAVLAMAVAEPILSAMGGWLGQNGGATVLILDDSYSMAAVSEKDAPSRFSRAKTEAMESLGGDNKPALCSLITTTGQTAAGGLTGQLDGVRKSLAATQVNFGSASLTRAVEQATEMLTSQSNPSRAIYIFSDLQQVSFEPLLKLNTLAQARDIQIFIIDYANAPIDNVGVTDLKIRGETVIDGNVRFVATIKNSSPAPRRAEIVFELDASPDQPGSPQRVIKNLAPAGEPGDSAEVTFSHRFSQAGQVSGEVRLMQNDDLQIDNARRFCLKIEPRVRVLVVRGMDTTQPAVSETLDSATMVELSLDWRGETSRNSPWPIRVETMAAKDLAAESFSKIDAVFFCDVPSFSPTVAKALGEFIRAGGGAVFFPGAETDVENYNRQLGQVGGVLPGRFSPATGQIGPDAPAILAKEMDLSNPLLAELFDNRADYPSILVQRYFPLKISDTQPSYKKTVITLDNGDPLLIEQQIAKGSVLWFATSASPKWSNLSTASIFPPMMIRFALASAPARTSSEMYTAGQPATITITQPPHADDIHITLPKQTGNPAKLIKLPIAENGVVFTDTKTVGLYRWDVPNADNKKPITGQFVVNPAGPESDLRKISREKLTETLNKQGLENVYISTSLQAVLATAAKKQEGRNLWDVLIIAVILLLVVEAVFANRHRR